MQTGLRTFVHETRSFRGLSAGAIEEAGTLLHQAERAFLIVADAHLVEARPTYGRFVGGERGVFVPGAEHPTSIDVGRLTITSRRVVLAGLWERREWPFSNLVAVHHDPDAPWTALPLSSQERVSGFLYPAGEVHLVRFRLMLALAVHTGTVGQLRIQLQTALDEHSAQQPPLP
ncbi:MAG TPA: hypothetical protein VGR20_01505 [Acidimicrobiia bacterium]|nr:hypothetical protein [Acidimicrobiia bacterium]